MARPKLNPAAKKVPVSLTLKPSILKAANDEAYKDGISLSALVDFLLIEYINNKNKK